MVLYGRGDFMLKKKINGTWQNISMLKKRNLSIWQNCSTVRKKYNGTWSIVWQRWNANLALSTNTSSVASYKYYAKATSGGNILIKLSNRQSSDDGSLSVTTANGSDYVFHLRFDERIYVDYVYTQSGNCYAASIFIDYLGTFPTSTTLLNGLTSNSSGTVSYKPTIDYYGCLRFIVSNFNQNASSSCYGQLEISRIYTDSKIFYWKTATLIDR